MKKIFAIALVLVLAISLLTACGGKGDGNNSGGSTNPPVSQGGGESNGGENTNDGADVDLTPSFTPAQGWVNQFGLMYTFTESDNSASSINVLYPIGNLDDVLYTTIVKCAEFNLNVLKGQAETTTFTEVTAIKVNGLDAAEFSGTRADGAKFKYIYVTKNMQIYNIQVMSEKHYDERSTDFQAMLDTFELK